MNSGWGQLTIETAAIGNAKKLTVISAKYNALTPEGTPSAAARTDAFSYDALGNPQSVNYVASRGQMNFGLGEIGVRVQILTNEADERRVDDGAQHSHSISRRVLPRHGAG